MHNATTVKMEKVGGDGEGQMQKDSPDSDLNAGPDDGSENWSHPLCP
jgi:hypothetical protein